MHQTNPIVTSCDWSEALNNLTADDFAYIDPPYLGANVGTYKADDLDHTALVTALEAAPYRWVLSEYADPLYLSRLGNPFFRKEMRHLDSRGRGKVVECLWKNF
jgi:site-specific DNA-adenine methylase